MSNNFRSILKSHLLREEEIAMGRKVKNERGQDIYITYYNLKAIIFLSYRIDSRFAKFFREWVVNALCEYNRMEKKEAEVIVVFNSNTKQSSLSCPNIPN